MLKIFKCIKSNKKFLEFEGKRFGSSKRNDCCKVCPPSYVCKQPEVDKEELGTYKFHKFNGTAKIIK